MTDRLAEVEARIGSVRKLAGVISAMRGIAASKAQEARRQSDSIRVFAKTIGDAISEALALLPETGTEPDAIPTADTDTDSKLVILLAAEQGFAGAFSERIFDAAADLLRASCQVCICGTRGLLVAEERHLPVAWSAPMIAHPAHAAGLATRVTEMIYQALAQSRAGRVFVVHAAAVGGGADIQIVSKQLVPFDYERFPAPNDGNPPLITLSPETLLARLVEEYVFAELSEAIVLSFAAENEARMRAMIAAHENVSSSLDKLVATSRRVRQEEITDEILELAAGSQQMG